MKPMDSKPLPYGASKTWHNRYCGVDFFKGKGAYFGVKLVFEVDKAEKLRKELRDCIKLAKKHNRNNIEIDANFGRSSPEGFKLSVRLYRPDEKD